MAHFSKLLKIVIDVPSGDYDREVSFWEGALSEPPGELHDGNAHRVTGRPRGDAAR